MKNKRRGIFHSALLNISHQSDLKPLPVEA
jgi:hypothetical protein